jgi:flagellar basal-body rod modification protein FlgD
MHTKIGSTPFPQRGATITEKSSKVQTTDPLAMREQFGDKSLDQILNSVADPNFQAKANRVKGVGNPDLDKDAFLKLMLAQLQQQDPTNPMQSHEMAAQLAQFTSVEQLTNINENMKAMTQAQGQQGQYDVLSLIGKHVSGDSSQIDRKKGDKEHIIEFSLPQDVSSAKVAIKDIKGVVVREYELNELKEGKNQLSWNGLLDNGQDARVGEYVVHIDAQANGQKVKANTQFSGAVDGVQFSSKGPVLMVGGKTLNLSDVKQIQVPKAEEKKASNGLIKPDTEVSQGAFERPEADKTFETANLDRELKNKLMKQ